MPGGDRTGPRGQGPMTGRAAGYCAGYNIPGYTNPQRGFGRGLGRGWRRGFGRGWGRGWYSYPPVTMVPPINAPEYAPITQPPTPEQEVPALENYHKALIAEKEDIEQELEGIKARIQELKEKLEK